CASARSGRGISSRRGSARFCRRSSAGGPASAAGRCSIRRGPDIIQDYSGYYEYDDINPPYYIDSTVQSSRNMLTLGLEFRKYPHSDFAPYGHYIDFGAHMVRMTTLDKKTSDNTFGIHVGLGRNYIFFDRLLLNYQIDYGYTYGLLKSTFGFEEETRPYKYYGDALLSNLFTIKLGIGFIPF
ncbi:MAG: hypothetical protein IKS44_01295, partial [Bacteroidales bacterium]|nr:hypothetical protein [Bacteroidales bacterium]